MRYDRKDMTKQTRTILFLFFLFLFILIAPAAAFYSQGYRFDFERKTLTQTGGFFLKAEPKQMEIYIDGKMVKKTDFFFGSALVENLLPKKHKIEVRKKNYLIWEKNLEIREKEVTEVKNLVLFPKNLNFNILAKGVEDFWFSPDKKKIILKETEEAPNEDLVRGWGLKLYDLEKKIKSHLISEREIYQSYILPYQPPAKAGPPEVNLLNLEFLEDLKEIYLDVAMNEQEKKFALALDKLPPVLTEKTLPTEMLPENIVASKKINNDLYYLDNSGYVLKNELRLNETPFPVQLETKYALETFQDFLFLVAGENLYLFYPESKAFEKIFEKIKYLKISPDNRKLVFFSNSEIWILFLRNERTKKAGEKLFLVRLSEKIGDVFWLNSDYLVFNSGNNLKIVEIDDRDRIQTWDIANFPNPEIYFNGNDRKLYILSEGNLSASEKLF